MRPLLIDDTARAKIASVVSYAMDHPYRPPTSWVPGDDPSFVAHLDTYRVVFCFTHLGGEVFRHLSISVPVKNKYPNIPAVFTIATEFGFTGWDGRTIDRLPDGWAADAIKDDNCVAVVQRL